MPVSENGYKIQIDLPHDMHKSLFGLHDKHLVQMEKTYGVKIAARGDRVTLRGDEKSVESVGKILLQLSELIDSGCPLSAGDIESGINIVSHDPDTSLVEFFSRGAVQPGVMRYVQPRSLMQKVYLEAINDHDMVISIGPAGTGKTYLAVAMACAYLMEKKVRRIILTRPAVEAGEHLGFLPGDIAAKVDPYLRPLYDALYDLQGYDKVTQLVERGVIEIAPIAFMRGRTLNDAFVILDEAQNTTSEQMKMFLTRMGFSSKVVVTGDVTQVDLPSGKTSGLKEARLILGEISGIKVVELDKRDVVRHALVQEIISAYERTNSS